MFLNCHSFFSLKYGTFSVQSLLEHAGSHEAVSLALTDINNTSGHLSFLKEAAACGIHPVVGVEFRNKSQVCYIALAEDENGLLEINRFLSLGQAGGEAFPTRAPRLQGVSFIYPPEALLRMASAANKTGTDSPPKNARSTSGKSSQQADPKDFLPP